ncbi:MAG: four helix bundle protein, partial [Bdellovibrionales bacterium]
AEYKRFIVMAIGSANEMLVWLDYAQRFEYLNDVDYFKQEYESICRMLRALHKSRSNLNA